MSKRLSLSFRVIFPSLLFFALIASAGIFYVSLRMDREALHEAENIARVILERNLATHGYFNSVLKPHVFEMTKGLPGEVAFDPAWMSSTYAVREIDALFQRQTTGLPYYYKECAINARSPTNEADALERSVLERMKADPNLLEWSERREIDGEPYYVYLLRGESMAQGCLRCHSEPEVAPAGLVRQFGPERSFGREEGELVSAISIRIPMGQAVASAASVRRDVSVALVLVLAVMGLAQWLSIDRSVVQPLRLLSQQAGSIASDSSRIGNPVSLTGGSAEVCSLADSFNHMSRSLHQHQSELEERVAERTQELEQANHALAKEVLQRGAAESAATAERDKFHTLFDQAADTIMLLRLKENGPPVIVDINRAGLALHGFEKADLIGKPVSCLDTMESAQQVEERRGRLREAGEARFEVIHITRDNRTLQFDVQAKQIDIAGVPHVLSTERDQTERIEMERRLRESQKLEAIGTLAGGIAHDFNNLLAVILGYSQMLKERAAADSEDEQDLAEVLEATRRAKELVRQILTFSRTGEGAREDVSMNSVITEAVELLRHTLPSSIELTQRLGDGPDRVFAEAAQMRQLVMNLCTNAYHAVDGEKGHIEVALAPIEATRSLCQTVPELREGSYLRLTVADDGHGMTAETKARIFEPFFTTKPVGKGTGMGMAVVHGVVRNLKGAVAIDTRLGEGTRVEVYLPLYTRETQTPQEDGPGMNGGAERILVVDDEPPLARMTKRLLEGLGYRVEATSSSEEALRIFEADPQSFDLILTDQTMPGMTGARLATAVRERRPGFPVLICTGYSETITETEAKRIGVAALLQKPVAIRQLATAIRSALG